jgi:hypothetical protein
LRGTVACAIAPGGAGKSTILAATALALASGRPLLGKTVIDGPKRVWLWNLEDDLDEMRRSIQAAAIHHDINPAEIEGRLFVDSGMEGATLCTATEDREGVHLQEEVFDAIAEELIRRQIDVVIIDPFVSSHEVDENANAKIDKIAKAWGRAAKAANCCVVLVHHTSKAGSGEVTVLSARGAGALTNAARCTLVLNRMDSEKAKQLGFSDDERRRCISVSDDKHNRAPAERADWYRLESVDLGNGVDGQPGDNIAVAMLWALPDALEGITDRHVYEVQLLVDRGNYRADPQSPAWVGKAVAQVLGWSIAKSEDKARIKHILKEWFGTGCLVKVVRPDAKSRKRDFVAVGDWATSSGVPPHLIDVGGERCATEGI